jgi:CheY-like chemotaxis protein
MRLLIADPDLHDCRSARLLLSHAGHLVVGATTSAPMAAALARETTPDLCLVDASLACGRTEDGVRVAEIIAGESGAPLLLLVGSGFVGAPGPEALARLDRPFGALELLEAVQICGGLLRSEPPPARVDRLPRLTLRDREGPLRQ